MEKQEKLVLIDGNSLFNRAFYALPLLNNSDGEYSNAVYGFCNILIKLIEAEKPKYIAVAFDMGFPTFRHKMYKDYKAGRAKMPDELACQLPILKNVLNAMNIKFVEQKGIEADDLVGTLSRKFDLPTIIISGDRDLFQLVNDRVSVWFTKKGITDTIVVTPQNIVDVYGVRANQVVDLKSIMGDSSDNIKGVAGIGEKGAKKLIETYGSLAGVYEHLDEITGKQKENLINGKESALLSQQLATINTSVPLEIELADLEYNFPFDKSVFDLFNRYEFRSIVKRAELFDLSEVTITKNVANKKTIESEDDLNLLVESMKQVKEFSIFVDDDIHLAVSKFEENVIDTTKLGAENVLQKLKPFLEDENIKKIVLNSKVLKHKLANFNIALKDVETDCNLALYLLSGSKKTDYSCTDYAEKFGYDKDFVAVALFGSKQKLFEKLEQEGMTNLYFDVELPLVDVLFDMEQNGFKVDRNTLKTLAEEYNAELETLTRKIYEDAGEEFNINSPKALGVVLFEKLGLKHGSKSKMSTSADVLVKYAGLHPIIDKILRYRKIKKLYGTYIEPFLNLADEKTGLIHTIFNQTLTATGRLSSSEPNLQNIPIRDEEGKNLRKAFVSRFENGLIVTSDYSQIELRLLAHCSGDEKLQYAYHNNIDIHSQTASDIYGVSLDCVTPAMRRDAKTVNFGILYGISDYGLSQNLNVSRKEAKIIIDRYFDTYKSVHNYMDKNIEKARKLGYVSTLLGRRRKIAEINSSNALTRQFGERAAMNMPLQGTASDIIKIAMVNVQKELLARNLKSKLILQIHDELIVDCTSGEEEIVKQILKDKMENAVKLSIPLTVDIESGKNWFEAK